jgi:putative colanic acid biosynthesis UDP-glucose lipid carrier transferase
MSRRIAIISSGGAHEELTQKLQQTQGVSVVGVFEYQGEKANEGTIIADLSSMSWRDQIDEVVIVLPCVAQSHVALLIEEISILPVDIWLCPAQLNVPILGTHRFGTLSLLQVRSQPIRDWAFLTKSALDYAFSIVGLVLLAPVMLAAALAIKLDSRGSVLFKQRRHGFNHRIIHVYKFRTMRVKEDGASIEQVRKDDERVTRVGRFLRRTSIDELPQLLNVLRGEMSLVGPRPHAVAHNQFYREQVKHYAHRHCVKPGITGWAQVHGFRGPTEDPEKMRQRIAMDLYYIDNWSIWMDLKVLAMTPFVVLFHRSAL